MDINERLRLFFQVLEAAPPVSNADEAMKLVCQLLDEIESKHCPIPKEDPPPLRFTGRMYPPQPDRMRRLSTGQIIASSRRHLVSCSPKGAISILRMPDRSLVFYKKGAE